MRWEKTAIAKAGIVTGPFRVLSPGDLKLGGSFSIKLPRRTRSVGAGGSAAADGQSLAQTFHRNSRSIVPPTATLIVPVSSETMTARHVSSVIPIPARWRVPSWIDNTGFIDSGRKQAAAAMRSLCTITAPSCTERSDETPLPASHYDSRASKATPLSIYVAAQSRAQSQSARRSASAKTDSRQHNVVIYVGHELEARISEMRLPRLPARADFDWKTTISANTTYGSSVLSSQFSVRNSPRRAK